MLSLSPSPLSFVAGVYRARNQAAAGEAALSYAETLVDTYGASEVWPLVDIASGTSIPAHVNSARNGTLAGWDLQNAAGPVTGTLAPYSDGTNDYGNIYSASLNTIWNGNVGSLFAWCKVDSASVWTDGASRFAFQIYVDGNNHIQLFKPATNNAFILRRRGSAAAYDAVTATISTTDWFSVGISFDTGGDEIRAFVNGAQAGSTLTGVDALTGALDASRTGISASSNSPTAVWHGWLAYAAVKFGSIWTPDDFAAMHATAATAGAD